MSSYDDAVRRQREGRRLEGDVGRRRRAAARARSAERAAAELLAFDVGPGSARLYRCDGCGAVDQWGPGWHWYGRLEGPVERVLCPRHPLDGPVLDD